MSKPEEFLQSLMDTTWDKNGIIGGVDINHSLYSVQRALTGIELAQVIEACKNPDFLYVLSNEESSNLELGINLSLLIYKPSVQETPTLRVGPFLVYKLEANHLPWYNATTDWMKAWEFFTQFTHTETNLARLKDENINIPLTSSEYGW